MIPKFVVGGKYPFVHPYVPDLPKQIEALRKENELLRAKLVAAQEEKGLALQHADRLRKEKERLRAKVASLKQTISVEEQKNQQLVSRIEELLGQVESLSATQSTAE
jgi:chromosome segregation ATPase